MLSAIRASLVTANSPALVDELLDAYEELKRNYYLGGLRLSEVEGGRFCEAAFRMLQEQHTGKFTPIGRSLKTEPIMTALANAPVGSLPDSVRLHIPRALRVVYDIRNNRDAAHLGDGIDPNMQDATLVVNTTSWVLAEFVRLHHSVSADEAHGIVDGLVTRQAPVIQDFDGFLKVLNVGLSASDHCLVILYQLGEKGATFAEINEWARPNMRNNLRRTLSRLTNQQAFVHDGGERRYITQAGQRHVEANGLLNP